MSESDERGRLTVADKMIESSPYPGEDDGGNVWIASSSAGNAQDLLDLAHRIERCNPTHMVGAHTRPFLYRQDIEAIVSALRRAASEPQTAWQPGEREAVARAVFGDGWKSCANLGPYVQSVAAQAHIAGMIDFLRGEEGDSVTVLCDNPEGPPNNAVECNGYWTNWQDKRFEGETLAEALSAAFMACTQWRAALAHGREQKSSTVTHPLPHTASPPLPSPTPGGNHEPDQA